MEYINLDSDTENVNGVLLTMMEPTIYCQIVLVFLTQNTTEVIQDY